MRTEKVKGGKWVITRIQDMADVEVWKAGGTQIAEGFTAVNHTGVGEATENDSVS